MGLTAGGGGGFVFSKYYAIHSWLNPQVWKYRQIQKANSKINYIRILEEMMPLTNALFKGQMYTYIWKIYM